MGRLLIVSNRLPVTVKRERGELVIVPSAGGLATALRGPHERGDSLWIGWPGDASRFDGGAREEVEKKMETIRAKPVYLTRTEINKYYEGFSNGVLWPLFHYMTDKVQREAWRYWNTYVEINRRFADAVASCHQRGDLIWVHDYQLTLVPAMLRRRIPDASIGFFLHIPFPSSEVFRILPWRAEILEGMLGADLIGFQTYSYARHFSKSVLHVLGIETEEESFRYGNRVISRGAFPIGIDAAAFERMASEPGVVAEMEAIRNECGGRKLIIGVDRLDYTKGLPRRMLALGTLLEAEPALRDKIRMIQVVVPSRTQVESYELYRRQLDEMVGRINGAHSTLNSAPVHYLFRSVTERQLVALYRAADVMLVTPLRDGMNLVSKEFVASRIDEDGVLVLSEFAGASAELVEALQTNPYDLERFALTIKRALTMPAEERQTRMRVLRRRVFAFDCYRWARSFIEALDSIRREAKVPQGVSQPAELTELAERIMKARSRLFLLDYDGTLVPFAETPELAAPDPQLKELLRLLAMKPRTNVHVVSGRQHETLERWLGALPIGLHAEHGYWARNARSKRWEPLHHQSVEWKQQVLPLLESITEQTPGSLIEEKTAGLAWHYRMADPELAASQAHRLRRLLDNMPDDLPIDVMVGSKVIEIKMKGTDKGVVVSRILGEQPVDEPLVVAFGDDQTDEDLFAALPPGGISIHVGPAQSLATYRLADSGEARSFLRRLVESQDEHEAVDDAAASAPEGAEARSSGSD